MAGKREKPEDIVLKLRQVQVLQGQGRSTAEAARQIGVTVQTYYRWCKECGGMSRDQLKRLRELEAEITRLRRAVSDLTLDKMILAGAARENFQALSAAGSASTMCGKPSAYRSTGFAAHWVGIARRSARCPVACRTKHS
jgi:putative transposase